jgi:hypothetical protein
VRRRAPARVLASLLLAALAAAGLVSCQPTGPRVVIFGDSITVESRGSGDWARILSAYQVDWSGTKFMTAPCNGLVYARNLRYVPDVVVINYSGNRGSFSENCMAGETGQALVDRYRTDVQALIDRYRNGRTKVVIVGAPARQGNYADGNLVFDALRDLANDPANRVGWYDGGRLLTPNRVMTRAAFCLQPRETNNPATCGTSQDPRKNYIRDTKFDHLCPLGGALDGTCKMYNSGAVRLSLNFRDGIAVAKVPVAR